jgi:hypothetical protein
MDTLADFFFREKYAKQSRQPICVEGTRIFVEDECHEHEFLVLGWG